MQECVLSLVPLVHRGQNCIAIKGGLNAAANRMIREFPGRLFSKTHSCWYIPYSESVLSTMAKLLASAQQVEVRGFDSFSSKAEEIMETINLPAGYHEQLIRVRYSAATVRTYESQMRAFLHHIHPIPAENISEEIIMRYMEYLILTRRVSVSTQNTAINAIKFYLERVLRGERKNYYIDRPIKEHKLPRFKRRRSERHDRGDNQRETSLYDIAIVFSRIAYE